MPATLTPDALRELVETGEIDTVLVCFPDLQGRLMGKRVIGHYFVEHLLDGGGAVEACNYLIALDVDMTPLPGYEYANWDQGYGDFRCIPDLGTLRRIPWLEATALVLCDLVDEETGEPVEESPRRILRRQIERAEAMGFRIKIGAELEFFLFENSYRDAAARDYRELTPHSDVIEDYHILQTTRDEYLIRQIRNGIDAAGIPVEFSKGEAGRGQHEINLVYADALEMADRHAIYKNGAKEIASLNGRSITFMAKYSMDEVGSSCHLHSSVWDAENGDNLMWSDDAPHHLSDVFRGWLGGIVTTGRELAVDVRPLREQLQALPARVLGADRAGVGPRQPHVRVPARRPRTRLPGGVAYPRRRRESLPRVRGDHRRRSARGGQPGGAARAVRRQRLRRARPAPRAVHPGGGHRAVPGVDGRA